MGSNHLSFRKTRARKIAFGAALTICGLVFASVSTGSAVDTAGNTSAPPQLGDRFPHSATSPAQPSPPRRSPVNTNASYTVGNVSVVDPSVAAGAVGGSEPSIAVDPVHPNHVAITRFTQIVNGSFVSSQPHWGNGNAHVLITTDGGMTWVDEATIPPPPGTPGTFGCPCDQTFDYGRDGRLYGTFLTDAPAQVLVVTGSTTDPTTASAWHWNGNPVQRTSGLSNDADQPWLLVNRDPANTSQDNVYVAWDRGLNVGGEPLEARVSVSNGSDPVNFTVNNKAGTEIPLATNPGLRLATDPRNGTVYALYQQSTFGSGVQPRTVTYRINRSVDAGATWLLNGSPDGQVVDTVPSNQAPAFKFGGVNALLGGVDHAAVDPTNGDVYVAYGQNVGSGTNQIKIRRLTGTSQSALTVGAAHNVSVSTDAALPSVAVTNNGTVGVLYDTHDGTDTVTGFPTFSVHFARSNDHGATFSDTVLESFVSPVGDNGNGRQRILGDYQQLKAVGNNFYGVFSGSRHPFDASANTIDPIFFSGAGIDNDLALVNVPANITTNATSPFGARVSYVPPTAIDESPEVVAVRCTPAPGSVFPIGTTTVTCEASDPDDTNSPVRASFTVTVRGAADQLHDLQLLVDRAPPGNSVRAKLSNASTALAIHDVSATCANLNAFVFEVRAQSGKKIPVATANAWIAAALQIEAVIPCPRT